LLIYTGPDKVDRMITFYRAAGVDRAAQEAKNHYMGKAYTHLENIQVPDKNKTALKELAASLLERNI
jgi:geranylgeranyl pyrophosphate synthase